LYLLLNYTWGGDGTTAGGLLVGE